MSTEKDFSLLRPFDREAAKRGEMLCWDGNAQEAKYWAGPDVRGTVAIEWAEENPRVRVGQLEVVSQAHLRMAPLAWVEGRPVYKGDVLYYKQDVGGGVAGEPRTASGFANDCIVWPDGNCGLPRNLTWTPPKVKREVKLIAFIDLHGCLRWIREELFRGALVRVPSEDKVITVEEPASQEGGAAC